VRDEKMLEKLATHEVEDVSELFNLSNKCTRAAEGRVWHSQPALGVGKVDKPEADTAAQSSGMNNNRKKKNSNNNKPLVSAPTAAVVVAAASGGHSPHNDK
jgi:ClpP class serine protease